MSLDLEKATKAAQCAELLCSDLLELVRTENLLLWEIAMRHLTSAQNLRAELERLVVNLKQMAGATEEWVRDEERTYSTLLLVGGHKVTPEAVASWCDDDCKLAEEWALCTHVHASDNDDVEVPRVPACVRPFMVM